MKVWVGEGVVKESSCDIGCRHTLMLDVGVVGVGVIRIHGGYAFDPISWVVVVVVRTSLQS